MQCTCVGLAVRRVGAIRVAKACEVHWGRGKRGSSAHVQYVDVVGALEVSEEHV